MGLRYSTLLLLQFENTGNLVTKYYIGGLLGGFGFFFFLVGWLFGIFGCCFGGFFGRC